MDAEGRNLSHILKKRDQEEEEEDEKKLKRGAWSVEEDLKLINYINANGEGRWNSLAPAAGLKRTGKSCRLRWLNYLRPDVRRGNITPQEQLIIFQLHSRWGNRWSKIARYLPGRTDNEIKNYWRSRVKKHAKVTKCDVNSKQFKDTMRRQWMPRLLEKNQYATSPLLHSSGNVPYTPNNLGLDNYENNISCGTAISDYSGTHLDVSSNPENYGLLAYSEPEKFASLSSGNDINYQIGFDDIIQAGDQMNLWFDAGNSSDSLWNTILDDDWFFKEQLNSM